MNKQEYEKNLHEVVSSHISWLRSGYDFGTQMTTEALKPFLDLHKKWLEADIEGRRLDLTIIPPDDRWLSEADFSGANLTEANLEHCNFSEANFTGAVLDNANLDNCDFIGANLEGLKIVGEELTSVDFSEAMLDNSIFQVAKLSKCNFKQATIRNADFSMTDLTDCEFANTDLRNADFSGADLTDVGFRHADMREADLKDVKLNEVYFQNADLGGAKLTTEQRALAYSQGANLGRLSSEEREELSNWQAAEEKKEQERLEAERLEQERLEAERLERERLEKEKKEKEKKENEKREAERLEAERLEQKRLEAERKVEERLEALRLEQVRLAEERKVFGPHTLQAIEALEKSIRQTDEALTDNKDSSVNFSFLAGGCYGLAVFAAVIVAITIKDPKFPDAYGYYMPVIMFLLIGSAFLRHDSKLRDHALTLSKQKFEIEKATGLLTASRHLAQQEILDDDGGKQGRLVKETFAVLTASLMQNGQPDQPATVSSDQAGMLKGMSELVKQIKGS